MRMRMTIFVAEYAVANKLDKEPALNWWVPNILQQQKRMINKVKNKYWSTTHKFGVKRPHTVEEALAIDKETGTNLWAKAIEKENMKVKVGSEWMHLTHFANQWSHLMN